MIKNPREVVQEQQEKETSLVYFLQQTKEGKYAEIEKSSIPYARIDVLRDESPEDEFFYSLR